MSNHHEFTVTLSVPCYRHDDGLQPTSYFEDSRLDGIFHGSPAKVRREMRAELQRQVDKALDIQAHGSTLTLVAGKDGTVLAIRYRGSWGYQIHGEGRHGLSGMGGLDTYTAAFSAALELVTECFGGLAWTSGTHSR